MDKTWVKTQHKMPSYYVKYNKQDKRKSKFSAATKS
jgi:hypothetical protein